MFTLAHKIRLTPTLEQRQALAKAAGCSRFAWNWALAQYTELKSQGVAKVSMNDLKKQFNALKGESFPWIYESPKDANQQPFANLKKALKRCYESKGAKRRVGFPKFKKKGEHDSFYLSNDKFDLDGLVACLPVIGKIKMTEELRFTGKIMSGTVSRTANDWFISVQVRLPDDYRREAAPSTTIIGVDLGLKTFAVTSDGLALSAPKPLKAKLKRLRRLSKQHSRKVKGSNNRKKSAGRLARLHQHITNIRKDFIHKFTSTILRENQTVVIEDLSVSGMLALWGRAVSDVGFAETRRQLEYKAPLYRRNLIIADRFFPSTKRCNACGSVKAQMGLDEREYICESCGVVEDRDFNASLNLRDYGLFVTNKLGTASPEVTPVEIAALGGAEALSKLRSLKQEFESEHLCSLRK
jgi:putative transposase